MYFVYVIKSEEGHRYTGMTENLGSTRVTVGENGSTLSAHDYYPFGKIVNGRTINNGNGDFASRMAQKHSRIREKINFDILPSWLKEFGLDVLDFYAMLWVAGYEPQGSAFKNIGDILTDPSNIIHLIESAKKTHTWAERAVLLTGGVLLLATTPTDEIVAIYLSVHWTISAFGDIVNLSEISYYYNDKYADLLIQFMVGKSVGRFGKAYGNQVKQVFDSMNHDFKMQVTSFLLQQMLSSSFRYYGP